MPLLCDLPPERPTYLILDSVSGLFLRFGEIFLAGDAVIHSACGHSITCFDHHFFHLVGIRHEWSMKAEREYIRATLDGFGKFELRENGSRAKNLQAAFQTFQHPDEVWEGNPVADARWTYIKEFHHRNYPFSIGFVTPETEGGTIFVPTSSFPCDKNRLKKWRQGQLVYASKTAQPPA